MTESGRRDEMPAELEAVFAAARAARPEPDARLMAEIIASAEAEAAAKVPRPDAWPRRRSLAELWRGLGGWPVAGTLAASLLLGVAVGGQPPVPLPCPPETTLGADLAGLPPGVDEFLTEG